MYEREDVDTDLLKDGIERAIRDVERGAADQQRREQAQVGRSARSEVEHQGERFGPESEDQHDSGRHRHPDRSEARDQLHRRLPAGGQLQLRNESRQTTREAKTRVEEDGVGDPERGVVVARFQSKAATHQY